MIVNQVGINQVKPAKLATALVALYDRLLSQTLPEPYASNPAIMAVRRSILVGARDATVKNDMRKTETAVAAAVYLVAGEKVAGISDVNSSDGHAWAIEMLYWTCVGGFEPNGEGLHKAVFEAIDIIVGCAQANDQDALRFDLVCDVAGVPPRHRAQLYAKCEHGRDIVEEWNLLRHATK